MSILKEFLLEKHDQYMEKLKLCRSEMDCKNKFSEMVLDSIKGYERNPLIH
jgi:hypothetical protein